MWRRCSAIWCSCRSRSSLAWLPVLVVSVFTCFLGSLVAVPVASFYIQNAAYHREVLS